MIFYTFDYQTKYYIGEIDISDPVKPYDSRIPGNAVSVQPPVVGEGQAAKWNGSGWDVVDIPADNPEEPIPEDPPPVEPTKAEKIQALNANYATYMNQLAAYYFAALVQNYTDVLSDIAAEVVDVKAQYELDLAAIQSE